MSKIDSANVTFVGNNHKSSVLFLTLAQSIVIPYPYRSSSAPMGGSQSSLRSILSLATVKTIRLYTLARSLRRARYLQQPRRLQALRRSFPLVAVLSLWMTTPWRRIIWRPRGHAQPTAPVISSEHGTRCAWPTFISFRSPNYLH